jgi:hypothetical protein
MRLLYLRAEEELTLPRVSILAHGEDGQRSFWFFRLLMSPAISRTRSTNAQWGVPCTEFCSMGMLEEGAYFPPRHLSRVNLSPPTSTKEGRSAANSIAALRPRS